MADRPDFIDLPKSPFDPVSRPLYTSHSALSTPDVAYPPAMSPLDALAFQGRLLAAKFEEESRKGRRMSRLPTTTVVNEFAKTRPTYFRGTSDQSAGEESAEDAPKSPREVNPENRPMSTHPSIHSDGDLLSPFGRNAQFQNTLSHIHEHDHEAEPSGYFSLPRSHSPEQMETPLAGSFKRPVPPPSQVIRQGPAKQSPAPVIFSHKTSTLVPPSPPGGTFFLSGSPSIRALMENPEDIDHLSLGGSPDPLQVRLPLSPFYPQIPRSPSLASERSVGSSGLPRPSFNYSRPLSRSRGPSFETKRFQPTGLNRADTGGSGSSRPSLDVPSRQDTGDLPLTPATNDIPHTPLSMTGEAFFDASEAPPSASYTYAKYSLPRSKDPKRESIGAEEFLNRQIRWDNDNAETEAVLALPTLNELSLTPPVSRAGPLPTLTPPTSSHSEAPSKSRSKHRPADITIPPRFPESSSPRRKAQSKPVIAEMTPEMHLEKGIECHENGAVQESTYHFRLAAKAGLPTAMVLYALACRHGWGMRPNPADAIMWLQKAISSSKLEVADDEATVQQGRQTDPLDRAKHKAQFALGAYELGMSYMKGWGVAVDKLAALHCFEIAGQWGDADALTEAASCYAEGVGCKKDMKKAARLYREAEKMGTSIAGNSWIYKEKYLDDAASERSGRSGRSTSRKDASDSKKRDKSRTRTFFGRKKSSAS
ncbi:hypothetical protein EJ06DRAFT_156467 [Trichodelitschia bisporula]|uniref:HCP-like protein n=1 Tax=Trichodelitschia bisporula TaxID=703511 RepID=A0A6G1HNT6_9PEZI|nr:hypothetical protein EJ06DRAFT_156467 [Trichodelitschia bisporula]